TTNIVLLGALAIFTKSVGNWLSRNSSQTKRGQIAEIFIKQMLITFPFVVSYNVFGRFSEILQYAQANGVSAAMAAFPAEMANFGATQGITIFLQSLFYTVVLTLGVYNWVNSQKGEARTRAARAVEPWIEMPF